MYCKNCGRELQRQTTFCPYCKQRTTSKTSYTYVLDEESEHANKLNKKEKFSFSIFAFASIILGLIGVGFGIVGMFQVLPFTIFAGLASLMGFVASLIGLREALRLYKRGLTVSYIGFFTSVTGIFLTVASIVLVSLG
jgi:RNA polymerase subunit RPABC4/transcription elongation factor Spt4